MLEMDTTTLIDVQVEARFLPEQSLTSEHRYIFQYKVTITNNDNQSAQLLSRSWLITDSIGESNTVEGDGVVGQQPILQPKQSYRYTSGCILKSPLGTMEGFYIFIREDGTQVKVPIKVFTLAQPNIIN